MRVMLLTQSPCRIDHDEEDQNICPGFSSETELKVYEASTVLEAVQTATENGYRVVTAIPARDVASLLSRSLDQPWATERLRGDFFGGGYSDEMGIPKGFYPGNKSNDYGPKEPQFYLDPRCDTQPLLNPAFVTQPVPEIWSLLEKGDKVRFHIPEGEEDFYWYKACGCEDTEDIDKVKALVRARFDKEWIVVNPNHGGTVTVSDSMEELHMSGPGIFTTYAHYLTLVPGPTLPEEDFPGPTLPEEDFPGPTLTEED